MEAFPHDLGTYLVTSRTEEGHHIVDEREGTCSCVWMTTIPEGGTRPPCAHLMHVRRVLNRTTHAPSIAGIFGARSGKLCRLCLKNLAYRRSLDCNTCRHRIWRDANPHLAAWYNLRKSAKRRSLDFTVTFERFFSLAMKAGYHPGQYNMRGPETLSCDRIREEEGYHNDNIQFITMRENSEKFRELLVFNEEASEWQYRPQDPF